MAGLVEKLVDLVTRAFYSDEHVVVMRALIREKFMKDDEMGNGVNLQTRQMRKIMNELHQDHMVCEEILNDKRLGGSSSTSYWYIDYKYFVDVVQYRLFLMQETLKNNEQLELERQTFQCQDPDCGREYTSLEAQRLLLPGQYQFRCGHCNGILKECDNNFRLQKIRDLRQKFKDQTNKKDGMRDGIYELLRRIGDFVKEGHILSSNLPSDNRAAGIGGKTMKAGDKTQLNGSGGGGGSIGGGGRTNGMKQGDGNALFGYNHQEIVVDIAGHTQNEDDEMMYSMHKDESKTDENMTMNAPNPKSNLPEFLQGSSISGHMAAKHATSFNAPNGGDRHIMDEIKAPNGSIGDMDLSNHQHQNNMTEEQRQEAFKQAYLAELERYNEENKEDEEVQVRVDKNGWDSEMYGENMMDDDDDDAEDIEWEWCETGNADMNNQEMDKALQLTVNGQMKRLDLINEDDLQDMTDSEFIECYNVCMSQ